MKQTINSISQGIPIALLLLGVGWSIADPAQRLATMLIIEEPPFSVRIIGLLASIVFAIGFACIMIASFASRSSRSNGKTVVAFLRTKGTWLTVGGVASLSVLLLATHIWSIACISMAMTIALFFASTTAATPTEERQTGNPEEVFK